MNFHKEQRSNETQQSATDPVCRLFRKSKGTTDQLCYTGHVLIENRNGMAVSARLTQASGTAERDACLDMLQDAGSNRCITLGGDKNYDVRDSVDALRSL